MFLAIRKDADNNSIIFLEDDIGLITRNLNFDIDINYFLINIVGNTTVLKPVTLKPGPRAAGRITEIAEIISDGKTVGSAEVPKP